MHILLGILALLGGAYYWSTRMRDAAHMAGELGDMAGDVVAAARRFGFRRGRNQHPVDALDDTAVAIAGAGVAFLELGGLPTQEQHDTLNIALRKHLRLQAEPAEEATILGRWLMTQSGGAEPGFTRLTRRLRKLDAQGGFEPLMQVLNASVGPTGHLSDQQREALADVSRVFQLN